MTNTAIKINFCNEVYRVDNEIWKLKDTNLPLNGKYEDEDGDIRHFKKGKYHNENGPSYIGVYGDEEYLINGKTHRIYGPAIFYLDGSYNWCVNGYYIDNEIINNWLEENDIPLDWNIWSDLDKMMFALYWSDYKG